MTDLNKGYVFCTSDVSIADRLREVVHNGYGLREQDDPETNFIGEFYPFLGKRENVILEVFYSGDDSFYVVESPDKSDLEEFLKKEVRIGNPEIRQRDSFYGFI